MPVVVLDDSSDTDVTLPQQSRYICLCLFFSLLPLHHFPRITTCECYFFQPVGVKKKNKKSSEVPLFQQMD